VLGVACGFARADLPPASLHRLSSLVSNYEAHVYGISADGAVPVGLAAPGPPGSAGYYGVRWVSGTPQPLWYSLYSESAVFGASADGSTVVGSRETSGGLFVPARWQNGQITNLTNSQTATIAQACSADGNVVVGGGLNGAFKWSSGAMQTLLPLSGQTQSWAYAVSGDGQTAIGESHRTTLDMRAVVWQSGTAATALAMPPGFTLQTKAVGVSSDGGAVIGWAEDTSKIVRACAWQHGTPVNLGALPVTTGAAMSKAVAANADGSVIIGLSGHSDSTSGNVADPVAFVWTQPRGMVDLRNYLAIYGLNASGWRFDSVTGISDDGRTIVGNGYDPTGSYGPWIATVPMPSAVAPLALLCVMGRRPRR
jgi:uncharacterized membrane protein